MKQIILIHGSPEPDEVATQESITPDWFRWVKEMVPNVVIPPMPIEIEVVYKNWVNIFEQSGFSNQSVLVGHSCGGGFLLRYLSEHPELSPVKTILIAPWLDPHNELSTDFMKFSIDSEITKRTEMHIFISFDDYSSLLDSYQIIRERLPDIQCHEFKDKGHFCGKKEFPELLEVLEAA